MSLQPISNSMVTSFWKEFCSYEFLVHDLKDRLGLLSTYGVIGPHPMNHLGDYQFSHFFFYDGLTKAYYGFPFNFSLCP